MCLVEVVLNRGVHFHRFLTAGKSAASRRYTCSFDMVSLPSSLRYLYCSCSGSHFQQLYVGSLLKQLPDIQTIINYYKRFTADQTKQKEEVETVSSSLPPEVNLKNAGKDVGNLFENEVF